MRRAAQNREYRSADWHPELIKAQVRMGGSTLTGLALANGLNESACRDALRTHRPEAEDVIARFIKVPKEELWPERYSDAAPSTNVDNATPAPAHRQNSGGR